MTKSNIKFCQGDDGVPLWKNAPTPKNIPHNIVIEWLHPYELCVVLQDYKNGTSLIAFNGIICYAVTECLEIELL